MSNNSFKLLDRKDENGIRNYFDKAPSALDRDGLGESLLFSNIEPDKVFTGDSLNDVYNKIMGRVVQKRVYEGDLPVSDENGKPLFETIDYSSIGRPDLFPTERNIFDAFNNDPNREENWNVKESGRKKPTNGDQFWQVVISVGDCKNFDDMLKTRDIVIEKTKRIYKIETKQQGVGSNGERRPDTQYALDADISIICSKLQIQDGVDPHFHLFIHKRPINRRSLELVDGEMRPTTRDVIVKDPETGKSYKKPVVDERRSIAQAFDLTKDAQLQDFYKEINAGLVKAGLPKIEHYLNFGESRKSERVETKEILKDNEPSKRIEEKLNEVTNKKEPAIKDSELTEESILAAKSEDKYAESLSNLANLKDLRKYFGNELEETLRKAHKMGQLVEATDKAIYKETELVKTTEVLNKKVEELAVANETILSLNDKNTALSKELIEEQSKNEDLIHQVTERNLIITQQNEDISNLKAELDEANQNYDDLAVTLKEEEKKYKTLESSHEELNVKYTELESKYFTVEKALTETEEKLETSENLIEEKDAKIETLEAILNEQEKDIEEKNAIISNKDKEIESHLDTISAQNISIDELKSQLKEQEKAKLAVDLVLEQAKKDLEELQVKYGLVIDEKTVLSNEVNALKDENKQFLEEREKLQTENYMLEDERDDLKAKFEEADAKLSSVAETLNFTDDEKENFAETVVNNLVNLDNTREQQAELLEYIAKKHGINLDKAMSEMNKGKGKNTPKPQ